MTIEIATSRAALPDLTDEALVIFRCENDPALAGALAQFDLRLDGLLSALLQSGELSGRLGECLVVHTFGKLPTDRLVLTGLGSSNAMDCERYRRASGHAIRTLREKRVRSVALAVPQPPPGDQAQLSVRDRVQAMVEGAMSANFCFTEYRSVGELQSQIELLTIISEAAGLDAEIAEGVRRGSAIGRAVNNARELCHHPGNRLRPMDFSKRVRALSADSRIEVSVLELEQMRQAGMGAILGVAQGSHEPPAFIIAEYNPGDRISDADAPIVLVGKTVTFDSGGISLKPALDMERMKADMGGGAAIFGAMQAIAELDLPLRVVALFPAVENMPGGGAIKPGDIVRTLSGKTVEIVNTDAEGRLILADALYYAQSLKPKLILDAATLTGASAIVFGPVGIGTFCTDAKVWSLLEQANIMAGEKLWALPLWPDYRELLKSHVADLRNISTTIQQGSMMTAATFLREFTGETPWAHLDIYNTSWNEAVHPYLPKGPTASGTRTIVQFLIEQAHGGSETFGAA